MEAIRCTVGGCRCECFQPGKSLVRTCDTCTHGWIAHALDKLGSQSVFHMGLQVEVVQPCVVFDIASLMLYGAQATPIRLKILLDRLFSVLQHEEVLQVLHGFGWSYEDYARGYILQEPTGRVLDKFTLCTREEEQLILQQFMRFGETKAIAQEIILRDAREFQERHLLDSQRSESDIKKFLERSSGSNSSSVSNTNSGGNTSSAALSATKSSTGGANTTTSNSSSASSPLPPRPLELRYPIRPFLGFPGLPSAMAAAKMFCPTMMPTYLAASPATTPKKEALKDSPVKGSSGSPVGAASPLSRLQTMQPFDCRRNLGQMLSPTNSDKSLASVSLSSASPQNMTVSSTQGLTPKHAPSASKLDLSPIRGAATPSFLADYIPKDPSGALDFSQKDAILASTAAAISASITKRAASMMMSVGHSVGADSGPGGLLSTAGGSTLTAASFEEQQRMRNHMSGSRPTSNVSASPHGSKQGPTIQRRNYSPTPGYGGTLVSPSGKKRVLCMACKKTFCDKGALKIHYSAVHLKEMHKCTVEGCTMMFSSRRSRNRHSANPNPKLHMPQNRRKLPDGVVCMDDSSKSSPERSLPNLQAPPTSMSAALGMSPIEIKPIPMMPLLGGLAAHQRQLAETFGFALRQAGLGHHGDLEPGEKRKFDYLDFDQSELLSRAVSRSASKKRKSVVPTRIAQQQHMTDEALSDDASMDGINMSEIEENDDPMMGSVKSQTTDEGAISRDDEEVDFDEEIDPLSPIHDEESSLEPGELPSSMPKLFAAGDTAEKAMVATERRCEQDIVDMRKSTNQHEDTEREDEAQKSSSPIGLDGHLEEALDFSVKHDKSERATNPDNEKKTNGEAECVDMRGEDKNTDHYSNNEEMDEGEDFEDGDFPETAIPMDADNPRKCSACGTLFPNHFSLKTHYQKTHLNLKHTCYVEGCNAAFPTKRSRDRHSSNLNLHRKLLSTNSSENGEAGVVNSCFKTSGRDEFLARIYEPQANSVSKAVVGSAIDDSVTSSSDDYHTNDTTEQNGGNHSIDTECSDNSLAKSLNVTKEGENGSSMESSVRNGGIHSSLDADSSIDEENNDRDYSMKGSSVTHSNGSDSGGCAVNGSVAFPVPEDSPVPDHNGDAECHVCSLRFRDNLVLKEHFEKIHPKEMYHCTIQGCDKVFSTRKSRNRHSQNENLHRHIPPKQAPVAMV